ncbi:MAG: prepilin-type N-terminal cleavage/methylation domain-containing protein [Pseudomonadota bacterium]
MKNIATKKRAWILRPLRCNSRSSGFTLIEVMIGLAIFSIGILGLTKMQISSIKGNDTAREFTEGATGATDRIEALMSLSFDDPGLVNGDTVKGKYAISWIVDVPDPNLKLKKITMAVNWDDNGKARTFSAEYYKAITF